LAGKWVGQDNDQSANHKKTGVSPVFLGEAVLGRVLFGLVVAPLVVALLVVALLVVVLHMMFAHFMGGGRRRRIRHGGTDGKHGQGNQDSHQNFLHFLSPGLLQNAGPV
jgi:hypothetical protein